MPKTGTDLVNEAKQRITEIEPSAARAAHASPDTVFVDVR